MKLEYSLVENHLADREGVYMALPHPKESLDTEATIARMLGKGTLVTRTDTVAVLNALAEVIAEGTAEGYTFNLSMFNTSFSISGVFDGPLDGFDPNRHQLHVNLNKGTTLREAEKKVRLEKINSPSPMPQIQEVKDSMSGTINDRITPGSVVELRGYNLKIEGDNPACGLRFVAETGEELKATIIIENKPSRIIAMIPALPEGVASGIKVRVKIVTQYTGGKLLKTPKTVVFPRTLTMDASAG